MADLDMTNPVVWGLLLMLAGASFVLLAKIFGLIFMRGKSVHRVGDSMNVNRAEVVEWNGGEGLVMAGGELWRATSKETLMVGDDVDVVSMNGLLLTVSRRRG